MSRKSDSGNKPTGEPLANQSSQLGSATNAVPVQQPNQLKLSGLKVTLPRMKVLELLHNSSQKHFTADDVHRLLIQEYQDASLATVYRVLTQFEQAGLVVRHQFNTGEYAGKAMFELSDQSHHDHLVCLDCGLVEEFLDAEIEKRQAALASSNGFQLVDHSLSLYAHCIKKHCPSRPVAVP